MRYVHIDTEEVRVFETQPEKFKGWVPVFNLSDRRGTIEIARLHRKAHQLQALISCGLLTSEEAKDGILEAVSTLVSKLTIEVLDPPEGPTIAEMVNERNRILQAQAFAEELDEEIDPIEDFINNCEGYGMDGSWMFDE